MKSGETKLSAEMAPDQIVRLLDTVFSEFDRLADRHGLEKIKTIGNRKFAYDLWGDTVNVASRMESHSEPGRIQVTQAVHDALKDSHVFEHRHDPQQIKGKGNMETYFLVAKR